MSCKKCDKCGEYHLENEKCRDLYLARFDEYGEDDPIPIRGDSFKCAAESFGEWWDGDEHRLLSSDDCVVVDIENPTGERKKFAVHASISIDYFATEV